MQAWLFKYSMVIFLLTLGLYVLTLLTVSYVGVQLTYVAIPVIIISGILAYATRPKNLAKKLKRV